MLCHFVTLQCFLSFEISIQFVPDLFFVGYCLPQLFLEKARSMFYFCCIISTILLASARPPFIHLVFCGLRIEAETPVFGNHSFFGRQNVDGCWCWQCYANIHFCKFAYGLSISSALLPQESYCPIFLSRV